MSHLSLKNKPSKKQIILWATLAVSALVAIVAVILMDFTSLGVPTIQKITGKGLIDSKVYYSGIGLYEYLENFNDEAIHALLTVHAIDYVFMIAVCVLEITVLLLLSKHSWKVLFFGAFPFLELFFDISENMFVDFAIKKLPEKASMLSGLAGGMTLCKWIFTVLYLVSAFTMIGFVIAKKIKAKKNVENDVTGNDSGEDSEVGDETIETIS